MTLAVLLDTQAFLWMHADPDKFSESARSLLIDRSREVFFSAVSSWEIAIKHALGRLDLPEPPTRYVPSRVASAGLTAIAVEHVHALEAGALPKIHQDPFDRMLVAQARVLDVPLMTSDRVFEHYEVEVTWAHR